MATWNPADRDAAIARGSAGGKLSDHERAKLAEAGQQAGSIGTAARQALQKAK